ACRSRISTLRFRDDRLRRDQTCACVKRAARADRTPCRPKPPRRSPAGFLGLLFVASEPVRPVDPKNRLVCRYPLVFGRLPWLSLVLNRRPSTHGVSNSQEIRQFRKLA